MTDKQHIFIVGSPRSGTTWLQLLVASHPQVASTVELSLFNNYVQRLHEAWRSDDRINKNITGFGLPHLLTEEEYHQLIYQFLDAIYERVLERNPTATYILDKHPAYALHTDLIRAYFPDAKIIQIIRDGRDVALSSVATRKLAGFGANSIREAAEVWKEHVTTVQHKLTSDSNYLELRYEDLHQSTEEVLKQVYEFCGLSLENIQAAIAQNTFDNLKQNRKVGDDRAVAPTGHYRKGKIGSWKDELSTYNLFVIDRVAGDLLITLGYAEPNWLSKEGYARWYYPIAYRLSKYVNVIQTYSKKALNKAKAFAK